LSSQKKVSRFKKAVNKGEITRRDALLISIFANLITTGVLATLRRVVEFFFSDSAKGGAVVIHAPAATATAEAPIARSTTACFESLSLSGVARMSCDPEVIRSGQRIA